MLEIFKFSNRSLKCRFCRLSSSWVKIHRIPEVNSSSEFSSFFSVITYNSSVKFSPLDKRIPWKYQFLQVFWWKFAKFFKLFSKPEVSFSSNFAWLFSVMKDNFAVLFRVKHYVLCTRGTNESAICLDVWVLGSEFTKFLSVLKQEIVFFF